MDKKNDDNIPKEINCYKIGKLLYSYGIYKVHVGTNSLTKEEVTIKIINKKNLNDNSSLLSSINNEIFFSKILSHNNILKLIDIYESSQNIFIIIENFKGEFLSSYMIKHKSLEESKALKIYSKIISAMIYLHNMNICHLNINLDSILIDENDKNKIKICDFKYGQYYYTKFKTLNNSVESNIFTCPEVSMSDGYIPELADVWSSGILLCYLLAGEYPINADKELDSNKRYIIPNNISQDLQDLLKNILDIDIDKRYRFDDILNSKYFIDNNYSNEILEENKNNHIIEKMNLRKIYERYLKEKSNLEKEHTQNLLINLENIINQDILINNKRMNKSLEINEESKNDDIDDKKINNIKNKENNKNIMNKSNKINNFKNNDKNKNKIEINKSNKSKKNKTFFNKNENKGKKTSLFENPESLLSKREEIKKPKIDKKENKKFIGQKISSSVENRKKSNNILDEDYKDFKKERDENKEKNVNKKDYRSSIIYENNNSNEPVFNFEEDGEDSENEESSINSNEKMEKNNISDIKNDSGKKKNNYKASLNKSFDSRKKNAQKKENVKANININKKDISNKKNENKNMNKYKTKIFNENANNSNESKNKKLLVNYHQKTEVNKFVKSEKKENKVQKYIKNTTNIIINNINDINKNKNEGNININSNKNKSNKNNNSKLAKTQKNEENDKTKNNYKMTSNKSSDNVIKNPNKYNNYKNLVISIKPLKNKNMNDFQSKTPTLKNQKEKEKEYTSKNIYNTKSENDNFSPNFGLKNTQNKSEEAKVNNFQKGNYYTSNYFYQKQNIRPSIINDSSNIIDSDDEDEIQKEERKFRERIKNIQMKNTLKAVKLEGEKVIIKKFTNRTKTPDNKSNFKKSNIFSKNYREKRLDKSFDDGKRMIENKSYVSKRNSTITNSDIVKVKNKNENEKTNNNYEVILENLKNLNIVFEQNEENDYHSYIRRKITQENIILKQQQNKKQNRTNTPIESDNDDSQSESENESESESENKSEKNDIDNNCDKETYNKELDKEDNLIKSKIFQKDIKTNNNIISKEDSFSDNSSSYKNIRINYNKDSENLNNDNINIINNEYKQNNKKRPEMKKRINLQEYINSKSFSINNPKPEKKEIKLIKEDKNKNNLNKSKDYIKAKKNLKEKLISISSDLSEEKVNTFNGPVVDLKYISFRNYEQTVNVLINEFIKKGVVFQKVGYNSFKCTKGIRNFYVEIVKIPNNLFYYRFSKKK